MAALCGIFEKNGLEACEERIYPLVNPEARYDVNFTVIEGITHILTAALNLGKVDQVHSMDDVMSMKKAAFNDLDRHRCYYCYNVHVVVGKKP